ncbi:MAG: hypothetical protein HY525_14630 [Betaproteobacteria bacterium]|nr:hypothetical protein [Betaproteobacteria bacterium]
MELSNRRWTDEEFLKARREVLAYWPTGREAEDLNDNLEYLRQFPDHKIFAKRLAQAKRDNYIMILPQAGTGTLEATLEHMLYVEAAGADSFFIQCDPYTRKLKLEEAQRGIELSYQEGRRMMTGYPFINYGVEKSRKISESVNLPLHFNGNNDEDGRLLTEIGFASGFTCCLMFDLRDALTHEKNYPLEQRIRNNQYICRLAAYYTERGVPFELLAAATSIACVGGTQGMGMAIEILDCLTAAEQGVKHLSLSSEPRGNLVQDVAAFRLMPQLAEEYLHRFGYHDVVLSSQMIPWGGEWPRDQWAAAAFMAWNTAIAVFGGVNWFHHRSPTQAIGIPSQENNAASVGLCRFMINLVQKQQFDEGAHYQVEKAMLAAEVNAIVEKAIEMGNGDPAVGRLRALEAGVIDVPFPSYELCQHRVLTIRDANGALRWFDHGNVPLPKEVVEYHRQKVRERELSQQRPADLDMVIEDIRTYSLIRN